jgi:hypothetical protein
MTTRVSNYPGNSHRVSNPRPAPRPAAVARKPQVLPDLTQPSHEQMLQQRIAELEAKLAAAPETATRIQLSEKFPGFFFLHNGGKPRFLSFRDAEWLAANIELVRKAATGAK